MKPTPTTCVSTALTGSHATYNVGPGQSYASLTAVPWLSLQPGDVVNIYYQPTPYATKLGIQAVGTASQPIIINGVTDANCNRPIITGANAVESSDSISSGYWATSAGTIVEGEGVIVFLWGPTQPYATLQSYITIQNIEVTGGKGTNTYTNHSGQVVHYDTSGTSGIYGVAVSNITFQYNTVTGNDEGIFINSQDQQRTSYYVTLRGNYIFGNGMVGNDLVHGVYIQAYRALYEGNYFGENIANSLGGTLKDRSSGTVIRNNYIQASLRAIDLVDTEESPVVFDDPLYNYAWVYGNVIVDDFSTNLASNDLIHWGGDSGNTQFYHNGTLFFYYNTVVERNDPSYERIGIFDLPTNQQSVDAADNIFYFSGNGPNTQVELGICCGTINLQDTNWISSGYSASVETGNSVTLNQQGSLLTGSNPLLNSDFTPSATSGSPVVGVATNYPSSVPNSAASVTTLQPAGQYADSTIGIVARPTVNDLGAYASH